jgi:hypothetical protein
MFRTNPFLAEMLSVIIGVLILVATIAFISIPYSLQRHPTALPVASASTQTTHPT